MSWQAGTADGFEKAEVNWWTESCESLSVSAETISLLFRRLKTLRTPRRSWSFVSPSQSRQWESTPQLTMCAALSQVCHACNTSACPASIPKKEKWLCCQGHFSLCLWFSLTFNLIFRYYDFSDFTPAVMAALITVWTHLITSLSPYMGLHCYWETELAHTHTATQWLGNSLS